MSLPLAPQLIADPYTRDQPYGSADDCPDGGVTHNAIDNGASAGNPEAAASMLLVSPASTENR
jgi:hypothetical protein